MPRPVAEARIQTAIRLPEEVHARLQVQASRRDLSVNWLVTKAIEVYLERLEAIADES